MSQSVLKSRMKAFTQIARKQKNVGLGEFDKAEKKGTQRNVMLTAKPSMFVIWTKRHDSTLLYIVQNVNELQLYNTLSTLTILPCLTHSNTQW